MAAPAGSFTEGDNGPPGSDCIGGSPSEDAIDEIESRVDVDSDVTVELYGEDTSEVDAPEDVLCIMVGVDGSNTVVSAVLRGLRPTGLREATEVVVDDDETTGGMPFRAEGEEETPESIRPSPSPNNRPTSFSAVLTASPPSRLPAPSAPFGFDFDTIRSHFVFSTRSSASCCSS